VPVVRLLFRLSSESDSKSLDICKYSGNFVFFFILSSCECYSDLFEGMTLLAVLANQSEKLPLRVLFCRNNCSCSHTETS